MGRIKIRQSVVGQPINTTSYTLISLETFEKSRVILVSTFYNYIDRHTGVIRCDIRCVVLVVLLELLDKVGSKY